MTVTEAPHTQPAPVFPEAKMHLVRPKSPVTGRLVESRLCTKAGRKAAGIVRHIAIDVSGTPLAGNFLVGQSFGIIPPGTDEEGRPHAVRLYSIACPSFGEDGKGHVVSTTVKRTIAEFKPQRPDDDATSHALFLGVASNYLCNLNPGDEVRICGPQGRRFLLPAEPALHDYVFLATGTGIAPFRGMLIELLEGPRPPVESEIHLVMGVPFETDLLYDAELRALKDRHPNFHYHTAISRECLPGCDRGEYVDQLVARKIDDFRPLFAADRTLIYICGVLGMQFGIYRTLADEGFAEGYLQVADDLRSVDPVGWTIEDMKRKVRTTPRVMLEVY